MQTAITVINLIHDTVTETDRPICHIIPGCSWREKQDTAKGDPRRVVHIRLPPLSGYLAYPLWAKLPSEEKAHTGHSSGAASSSAALSAA